MTVLDVIGAVGHVTGRTDIWGRHQWSAIKKSLFSYISFLLRKEHLDVVMETREADSTTVDSEDWEKSDLRAEKRRSWEEKRKDKKRTEENRIE